MADISRADALALINEQNSSEIFQEAAQSSAALRAFRTMPMTSKQKRMPIIDALPTAGFVTGDTGRKPTTEMVWANKQMEAEEIACIVPIPENVFDDSEFDIWAEVRPRIAEAFGKALDAAVFFGTGKPASWPEALVPGAIAAGNSVSRAAIEVAGPGNDLAESFNQLMGVVEADGFDPDTIFSPRTLRVAMRGLRDENGSPLFAPIQGSLTTAQFYGGNLEWVRNGSWNNATAQALAGQTDHAIIGLRQDITYKILTEATLTDGAGNVVFSLAEQDMIALRCKMRVGFQVADPTTIEGGSSAYPFAALVA